MKALINAYGKTDSLNQDRLHEVRGLVRFRGKPVIQHTLDKLSEIGVKAPILMYINPEHREAYQRFFHKKAYSVNLKEYSGNSNPLAAYFSGLQELGDDNVLLLADDNIFDFSLKGLLDRFAEVDDNVLAVQDLENVVSGNPNLNFGRCQVNEKGRITKASYSFDSSTRIDAPKVIFDIYLIHKKRIPFFLALRNNLAEAAISWWKDFYVWEPVGFWADIGKPELRRRAEEHFS